MRYGSRKASVRQAAGECKPAEMVVYVAKAAMGQPSNIGFVMAASAGDLARVEHLLRCIALVYPAAARHVIALGDFPGDAAAVVTAAGARVTRFPLEEGLSQLGQGLGLQLALNEGNDTVVGLDVASALDFEEIRQGVGAVERRRCDVCFFSSAGRRSDNIAIHADSAFVAGVWGQLGDELAMVRHDVVVRLLQGVGRRCADLCDGQVRLALVTGSTLSSGQARELARRCDFLLDGGVHASGAKPVVTVAVITPYHKEPLRVLERCHQSVARQTYAAHQFMIADGEPSAEVDQWPVTHIVLDQGHRDNGNTPRGIGGQIAFARGFDAVAYLDADNWFDPDHIATLVHTQRARRVPTVCAFRRIHLPDGTVVPGIDEEDEARTHVDTSAFLFSRERAFMAAIWSMMPAEWGPVCDRIALTRAILAGGIAWTGRQTINFESNYSLHYRMVGKAVPALVHDIPDDLRRKITQKNSAFRRTAMARFGRVIPGFAWKQVRPIRRR